MGKKLEQEIENSLKILQQGGVILYPTDTVWGLGCDATDPAAVEKIFEIKKRPDTRSMLVLLANESSIMSYVRDIPEISWELLEVAVNPLTIIYPSARNLAHNLVADDGSIGIRIVKDEFCEQLIRKFRKPLVSTSANISGEPSPAIFDDITPEIMENADYIVDWRRNDTTVRPPSSIIKLDDKGRIYIIR